MPAASPAGTEPEVALIEATTHPTDLSERAKAWTFTRDARTLWPGLDPALLQPCADAIARTVTARLRGESATLGAADGRDAFATGVAALLTGTGPLLGYWVEQRSLDVSDALADILAKHLGEGRTRVDRIASGLGPALSRLVAAGISPAIMKGFHTAHVYFPEPGLRPISDVDVVVAPCEIGRVDEALRAAGFKPSPSIATPYKRDWYPPDDDERLWSLELFHSRDRWKIEVHDGANFGELTGFGFHVDPENGVTEWRVADVTVRTFAQPMLTIILAAHLAAELHTRCLLRVIELVFVIRRDCALGLLDWRELDDTLERFGVRRFVYPALALVERVAPGTVDASVLARARGASTRLGRAVIDRLTPTSQILDDRPILSERLMWIVNPVHAIRSAYNWINPQPRRSARALLDLYHSRAIRLLSGRASLVARRGNG